MSIDHPGFFRYHRLAIVVFAAIATLFLWDVLFLDYSLGAFDIILNQPSWKGEFAFHGIHQPILSDSPAAHYPQREFEWGHARLLSNPEFNPYIFTGMPWASQGAGAFITSVPQLFLDVRNAIDWSTWLRLVCAGFFMYLLMLELGLSRTAGIFAGILWTYNLHQVVWLEFPQHLATQLWIPLLFLFNYRILNKGLEAPSAVGLLVVNVLFFTSGYTQIVLYTYITIGIFNTVYVLAHAGVLAPADGLRRWTAAHAIYIAAVLLCATGVFAEMQYISEGLRGAQDWRGRVAAPELSLESIAGLILSLLPKLSEVTQILNPDYYGGIWEGRYHFEHGNIVETARYFGVLGVLFCLSALFLAPGAAQVRTIVSFAVVTALMFSLFYRNEFTMSLFRLIPFAEKGSYSRFITPLTFFGCVLAGYGLHHGLGSRYRRLFAAMAVLAAVVLLAELRDEEFAIWKMWYPAVIIAGLGALVVLRNLLDFDWKWVGWLVVAVTVVDLFAAGYAFNTRMENDRLFPANNAIRFLLNDPEPYRVAVISDRPLYQPNILSFYDIPVVEGYSTVLPVDYARYIDELFPEDHVTRNGILFLLKPNIEALRLMNVKYVLSDQPLEKDYRGVEHILDTNNHAIYRIRNHLPRLFCASDVFHAEGKELLETYDDKIGKYDAPVVVEGEPRHESYPAGCRIDDLEAYTHGVVASIQAGQPRYVVVPYVFSENWNVSVNGERREPRKANGYHMAVQVPAGTSRIEIFYRNDLTRVSAWIFIAAALALLVYAWRARGAGAVPRVVLAAVAVIVAFKSALSLPAVRNDRIPERAALVEKYDIVEQRVRRVDRELHSDRVSRGNPVQFPLNIDSRGLTRLSLLAGTFRQARLEQRVTVEILDADHNVLVTQSVPGEEVLNNNWFSIDFPPIRRDTELYVRVSTRAPERSKSFILWREPNGEICVQAYYRVDPETA